VKIEVQIRSLHFQCTCFLKISWNRALLSSKWCYTRQNWQDYHGLRGSASPVLTATGFVNGRWQFSTPHRIHTPWPITKKFGTGDYVRGPYGCAKFGANPSMGGFWANGWNITKFFLFKLFFHQLTYRSDATTDFHAWWFKRRGLAQGCAFWGFRWHCSPF